MKNKPMLPAKKVKKGTFGRLLKLVFKGNILKWILVVVCIVLSTMAILKSSLFIQDLIDKYIVPLLGQENPSFKPLINALINIGILFGVGIIASFFRQFIMIFISQGVMKNIRDEMFSHMQELPIRFFDTHTHGDVMSYYTNDTDTLMQMISQSIPQTIASGLQIVMAFVTMCMKSIHLTAIVILSIAIILTVTLTIAKKSGKLFLKQQKALADINGFVEETIGGQKVVKVFCHEEKIEEEFDEKNDEMYKVSTKANTLANIMGPLNNNLGHLQYVILAVCGSLFAISGVGGLTLGAVASFLQLSRNFSNPINEITQQLNGVVMALAGAERIFELLDQEKEKDDGYVKLVNVKQDENGNYTKTTEHTHMWAWEHKHRSTGETEYVKLQGDIVLDGVDFSYDGKKEILHNVSVYAKPGQKIALVGATGAGKTTITNLINRFYDIEDGKIRYDGININKINKQDLRRSLGIVLQDTNLFSGTIMENIRYGRLDATDEEVIAAAKKANADGFIRRLPDGYNTYIEADGGNLSGGQRQLISIARAAVCDPPVMILDEATSSIDTRTEKLVQEGMDELMQGRTVFVIAHRLSTIQNANAIMVLEDGRIIERGDHDDLIKQKGKYYQLYTGSFK